MGRRILWCGIALTTLACQTSQTIWKECQVCPATDIVNFDEGFLDPRDKPALDRATQMCKVKYKESVCLVSFTRIEPGNYVAICGRKVRDLCPSETQ